MKLSHLQRIINECIKEALVEADIVPTNKHNEANLRKNPYHNAWDMLYKLMDNVRLAMEYHRKEMPKKRITSKDVNYIIDYINQSIVEIKKMYQ
jgi:hypothetical protein